MAQEKSKPAPLEIGPGEQKDDNIDDLGQKDGGGRQEQPTDGDKQGNKSDDTSKN